MTKIGLPARGWRPVIWFSSVLLLVTTAILTACESQPESQPQPQPQPQREQDMPKSADASESAVDLPQVGICTRHKHIQGEILWWLGKDDCADVSDADLARIDGTLQLDDHYTFTALDVGDLRGLSSLEGLFMSFDMIALRAGVFDDLTNLRELRLYVDGHRPRLPEGLFDRLTRLEELVIQTGDMHQEVFSKTRRLRKLWLLGGGLVGVNVSHLSRLEELLVRDWIPRLEADTFAGLTGLRRLDIDDVGISEIDPDAFSDLKSLRFLNLRNNQITALPAGVFNSLILLEELWLYENPLTALPPGIFDQLVNLKRLDLGTGKMTSLDADIFDGLAKLRELSLLGDNLAELPTGLLQPLSNLYRIDLRWRPETSGMPPDLFLGLQNLTSVHVYCCPIEQTQLTVKLQRITSDSFAVNVAEAAPFAMAVRLTAEGGILSTATVTVPAGETSSEVVRVAPTESDSVRVNAASWSFPENYRHYGFEVLPAELWEPLVFSFE